MKFTSRKVNTYMMFKLPSAYLVGVRLKSMSDKEAKVQVKLRWINKNPFKSMFWAVQGMAAELSTGVLMMQEISKATENISMLVTNMKASFHKKAKGKIIFECNQGVIVEEVVRKTIVTKEGQIVKLKSSGFDESGELVSSFEFEWSIKLRS